MAESLYYKRMEKINRLIKEREKMYREIKFRGKRKDNGEWVKGYPIESYDGNFYIGYLHEGSHCIDGHVVIPETVGQFIRLKDKNGKEVYEGDIILIKGVLRPTGFGNHFHDVKYVVKFKYGHWCLIVIRDCKEMKYYYDERVDEFTDPHSVKIMGEVIGNIHDIKIKEK